MAHELVVSMSFPFECNFVREYLPPALISTKKPKDKGRRGEGEYEIRDVNERPSNRPNINSS